MRNISETPLVPTMPRQVAEAIEYLRNNGWRDCDLVCTNEFLDTEHLPCVPAGHNGRPIADYLAQSAGNLVTYAAAIVNGYEVEKSAEELAEGERRRRHDRFRTLYCTVRDRRGAGSDFFDAYSLGVSQTLSALEIEIEGVNA
jgi:hypothetical protein